MFGLVASNITCKHKVMDTRIIRKNMDCAPRKQKLT